MSTATVTPIKFNDYFNEYYWALYAKITDSAAKIVEQRWKAFAIYRVKSAAEIKDLIEKLESEQKYNEKRQAELQQELDALSESWSKQRVLLSLLNEIEVKGAAKVQEEFEKNHKIVRSIMNDA